MRLLLLCVVAFTSTFASADRLINTPTGRKIPYRTIRFESMSELSRGRTQETYTGLGISTLYDLEVHSWYSDGQSPQGTIDLSYNVIAPVPDLSPGISFGVQDMLDRTPDGRRGYFAITLRPLFATINGQFPADVSLGGYVGRRGSAFAGVSLPFSREFRMLFEHSGLRLAFGFELRPLRTVALRLVFRERDALGSFSITRRF